MIILLHPQSWSPSHAFLQSSSLLLSFSPIWDSHRPLTDCNGAIATKVQDSPTQLHLSGHLQPPSLIILTFSIFSLSLSCILGFFNLNFNCNIHPPLTAPNISAFAFAIKFVQRALSTVWTGGRKRGKPDLGEPASLIRWEPKRIAAPLHLLFPPLSPLPLLFSSPSHLPWSQLQNHLQHGEHCKSKRMFNSPIVSIFPFLYLHLVSPCFSSTFSTIEKPDHRWRDYWVHGCTFPPPLCFTWFYRHRPLQEGKCRTRGGRPGRRRGGWAQRNHERKHLSDKFKSGPHICRQCVITTVSDINNLLLFQISVYIQYSVYIIYHLLPFESHR